MKASIDELTEKLVRQIREERDKKVSKRHIDKHAHDDGPTGRCSGLLPAARAAARATRARGRRSTPRDPRPGLAGDRHPRHSTARASGTRPSPRRRRASRATPSAGWRSRTGRSSSRKAPTARSIRSPRSSRRSSRRRTARAARARSDDVWAVQATQIEVIALPGAPDGETIDVSRNDGDDDARGRRPPGLRLAAGARAARRARGPRLRRPRGAARRRPLRDPRERPCVAGSRAGTLELVPDIRRFREGPAPRRGPAHQASRRSRRSTSARSSPSSRSSPTTSCRGKTAEFRQRLENGETLDELLFEAFAAVREALKRTIGPAPLRRAADGRHRPPRGRHRRDEDRRGQDLRRDAGALPERARRQAARTSSRSTTTSPSATRSGTGPSSSRSACAPRYIENMMPFEPAQGGLRRRRHLRHELRVRLRLPARQHGGLARRRRPARPPVRDRGRGRLDPRSTRRARR